MAAVGAPAARVAAWDAWPVAQWCREPAPESGPDVDANPVLSPPARARAGEHAEQTARPIPTSSHARPRLLPDGGVSMDRINPRCAGIDVHRDSLVVCVRLDGRELPVETFGTTGREILRLGDRLAELGVTTAAMESTGVYWRPAWNLLEDRFKLVLVNAQHVKRVPGRKTDVTDAQWLARLHEHGLLAASFVPPR